MVGLERVTGGAESATAVRLQPRPDDLPAAVGGAGGAAGGGRVPGSRRRARGRRRADATGTTLAPAVRGVLLFSCLGAAALVGDRRSGRRSLLRPRRRPARQPRPSPGSRRACSATALFALLSRALYARGEHPGGRAWPRRSAGWPCRPPRCSWRALLPARRPGAGGRPWPTRSACWCSARLLVAAVRRAAGRAALAGAGPGRGRRSARRRARRGSPGSALPLARRAGRRHPDETGALAAGHAVRGRGRRRVPRRGRSLTGGTCAAAAGGAAAASARAPAVAAPAGRRAASGVTGRRR